MEPSPPSAPAVTVIVPTYNYGHFITDTLDDLRRQTLKNWECVVVDDGSRDNTREIVERYIEHDPRFTYIYQENQGLSAARNTGLRAARGTYIQLLDADDKIETRKLELQVSTLQERRDVDIVYGGVRYFSNDDPNRYFDSMFGAGSSWMPRVSGRGEAVLNSILAANIFVVNAALTRKGTFDEIGFFDETLRAVEDWDYWLRCALAGKSFLFDDREGVYALVRSHPDSMSKNRRLIVTAGLQMRAKLDAVIDDPAPRAANRWFAANEQGHLGIEDVVEGHPFRGIGRFLTAGFKSRRVRWLAYAFVFPIAKSRLGRPIHAALKKMMNRARPAHQ